MSGNKGDSDISKKDESKEHTSQLKRPTLSKIGTYTAPKVAQENRSDSVSRSSTSSRDHGTILTADTEQFIIGQKVWVGGISPGQIAYIGETHFAPGEWAGVVLDEPNGKNDGCVAGKRYFQCEAKKGIFSRLTRLTLYPLEGAAAKPAKNYSPDRSRTVSPTPSTQSVLNRSMGGRHGFTLGDRVIVSSGFGSRPGILRYLGETQFASGNWCGIELDEPNGKNDGSVEGVKYFECKPKYGIFVPVAKVSLSPSAKKSRLSRACSKESLTSVGTMNSIATTNTSRLRMQRYSMSLKQQPPQSASKSSFSMQDLLREKQNHIEQLMIERDMEQEDAQNQALQFQKIILELKSKIDSLEKNLEEEKNKTEDLQLSIEEANFCGDELNAQTQVYKEKITDLEQRLRAVTSGETNIQLPVDPVKEEVVVKTEVTSTPESKYDIQQRNNQYSFNQNEKSKLDNHEEIKALNDFRNLFQKIKDSNNSETNYQEQLNRYIKDPDEIRRVHSIKVPLNQMGDTFLKDLCESLAVVINEINSLSIENKNILTKSIDFEKALTDRNKEIDRLENEKTDISKKLESVTVNYESLSKVNEEMQKEKNVLEETVKQLENEKNLASEKLQFLTSNCEQFAEKNKQLHQELELQQENTKQIEKEKLGVSQKLEDVLLNCKSLSEINEKMQAELKINAEKSNLLKGEQLDVSRKFEDISSKCSGLAEQNENLLNDLQKSEDKLRLLETQKLEVQGENTELLAKLNNSTELIGKLQQQLQAGEDNSSQLKKEIEDISQKLNEMSTNCQTLSDENKKLVEDLNTSAERLRNVDEDKTGIHKTLEETSLKCKTYEELNNTLKQTLTKSEEKLSQVQAEKETISASLEELKTNHKSLSDLTEKMKEELSTCLEKISTLESEKFICSQKLDEESKKFSEITEANNKLQAELNAYDEKLKAAEKEKFDTAVNFEEIKLKYENALKHTEDINLDLKTSNEKSKLFESEIFDISQKLEEVQSTLKSTLEQNENLQQKLKTAEENSIRIEKEKFEISRNLEEMSLSQKTLLEQNQTMQNNLKANEDKIKLLEENNFDISLKLKDAESNYELLSDVKNKLQEEFLSKNEGNTSYCNNLMQQNEKLQQDIKSVEEQKKELELEKFNLHRKLEEVTLNMKSTSESNENQRQELQAINDKYKLLEIEKFDISQKLEESSSKYCSILETKNELEEELNLNKEKTKRLEEKNFDTSRELADQATKLQSLSEESSNLQLQLKNLEEKLKEVEAQKFELTGNLKKVTSDSESLSEENTHLKQELLEKKDALKQIEEKEFKLSQKLDEATIKNEGLTELSNKLEQELQIIKDTSKQLDVQKGDVCEKLESLTINCKKLENTNEKLQKDLELITEKCKLNELEKVEISQKLSEITTSYGDLSQDFENLKQELKKTEEKTAQLSTEKDDISGNLVDATLQIANLSDLSESLQQKNNIAEEKCRQFEVGNLETLQKLEKVTEQNNKLEQDLKAFEEKVIKLETEKSDLSGNLIDATVECKNLSDLNEKLQQNLKDNEEKFLKLEQQNLEAYQKLENSNLSSESLNGLIGDMQQKLKAYAEKEIAGQNENSELSEKLEKATNSCKNLSELNEQLQNDLKNNKEQIERFEKEHSELKSIQKDLYEQNEKLQKQIKSLEAQNVICTNVKIAEEPINPNVEIGNISSISALLETVKSELETEYFRDVLKNNDALRNFSQNIYKIESFLSKAQKSNEDTLNTSIDSNTERVLLDDSISKASSNTSILEKRKAHQNVHNEFVIGRLHLGNQLQDIYQLINSIKSHIQNLDQDIQSLPSQNGIRIEMLNSAEEKSCKLNYDFTDLTQRFEALVKINEKYPSLKDSISKSILDEAKKNIKEQEVSMEFDPTDEIELLQSIVINYQLVLKARDVEIASNLIAKSSLEPLSPEKSSNESVLKSLQTDLESTRKFINKLEELNFILKCLRYFQFKISKQNAKLNAHLNRLKNDKDSLEDICKVTLQLRDAEKQLIAECAELIKILVDSMETFENSKQSLNQSGNMKNQLTVPISSIDKSIKKLNNIMNSNSDLLELLCKKVASIEEKMSDVRSRSLLTDIAKLDTNTKIENKVENMDEKTAQINFLHSIIADMQQKNDKLKDKIETLESFSSDNKKSFMYEMITKRKPAPRMFCDICEQFDIHETEDCPMQESNGGEALFEPVEVVQDMSDSDKARKLPAPRKYCQNCEVFDDHETEDCYAGLDD
ncbi:restin homolog [Eupeodes corollae]|uniref:restin homolog n=1 Tax=Eupeodes corollae TaxID=290404 RepID=UPI002490474B|nr:restin homolog [Eupeodes corollae]